MEDKAFYLIILIYERFMKDNKGIYVDLFYEEFKELYEDFKAYDNEHTNRGLFESVTYYLNDNEEFIKRIIERCDNK